MTKASRGAHTPGAQGYSLAEAIDGLTPTGVSGDDSRDPSPVKCRWKGCPTILNTLNRPGRKPLPKTEEPEEEPGLDQSGIRESVPPEEPEITPNPDSTPKKAGRKKGQKGKKGHVPTRKFSKAGLCFPHQQAVNFYEMGLEDAVPVFEDDPVAPEPAKPIEEPAKPEPETPTDT